MVNEIARSLTWSENAYFANKEQAPISVFMVVFFLRVPNIIQFNLNCIIIDQRKL